MVPYAVGLTSEGAERIATARLLGTGLSGASSPVSAVVMERECRPLDEGAATVEKRCPLTRPSGNSRPTRLPSMRFSVDI